MALDDAGIFECEFRDPPDPMATLTLDRIDSVKIKRGRERLVEEQRTGKVHGYRMFRTPEDVAAGRFVLDESDTSASELNRAPVADPFAPDTPLPAQTDPAVPAPAPAPFDPSAPPAAPADADKEPPTHA